MMTPSALSLALEAKPPPPTAPPPQWLLEQRDTIIKVAAAAAAAAVTVVAPAPPPAPLQPSTPPPRWLWSQQAAASTLTSAGNVNFFKSAGCERFDAVLLGDSLGRAKKNNSKKTTKWYLNEVVDELLQHQGMSVCAAAIPGCQLGHPSDNYKELIHAAPSASTCLLQIAGNDFLGQRNFLEGPDLVQSAKELRPLLQAKYSRALVVIVGTEESWKYSNYGNAGLFNNRMDALAAAFRACGISALRSVDEFAGVHLVDSIGHHLYSESNMAIAKHAWRVWCEAAIATQDFEQELPAALVEDARRSSKLEGQKKRIAKAAAILGESTCRVYCDGCMEWRFARGFAAHRCCTESSCKDVDRIMSFASAQINVNAEAWAIYGKTNRIADFVLASAPEHLRDRLWEIQRGTQMK